VPLALNQSKMKTKASSVIAILLMAILTIVGCQKNPPTPPPTPIPATIKMNGYTNLGLTGVTINYTITPNDSKISESGVYVNIRSLLDGATKVAASEKMGIITLPLTLKKDTRYYIWAYVKTSQGTSYSSMVSIWTYGLIDVDGNGYHTVKIGSQIWTVENLRVTHYNNGDLIPEVPDSVEWYNDKSGARCYYDNNKAKYDSIYGALYNWYVISDPRGITPKGWHVPTGQEYADLSTPLGNTPKAGGAMKEKGTKHWHSPNTGATNSSGFTALPGGARGITREHRTVANFMDLGYYANFWTSSKTPLSNNGEAWHLDYNSTWLNGGFSFDDNYGFSIRLIKNK